MTQNDYSEFIHKCLTNDFKNYYFFYKIIERERMILGYGIRIELSYKDLKISIIDFKNSPRMFHHEAFDSFKKYPNAEKDLINNIFQF